MPQLGVPELLIILAVVILIFGVGRLPEIGGALGKGIKEFRRSAKTDDDQPNKEEPATVTSARIEPTTEPEAEPQPAGEPTEKQG